MGFYMNSKDGLMFCVVGCFRNKEKINYEKIVSIWDGFDHYIPKSSEVNQSLCHLCSAGFISIIDNRIIFHKKYRDFERKNRVFNERHITMQIRYQDIFNNMFIDSDLIKINFFNN